MGMGSEIFIVAILKLLPELQEEIAIFVKNRNRNW